ncbi:MAG: S46 family peptidase [Bacteroidota bacterium]
MNKQIIAFVLLVSIGLSPLLRADEGMWLPFLLGRNYEDMKKHGLNLTQEEIYSINNASIKDAIVSFGGFCTAEVISQKGLLLTNHHCGYNAIADASSEEDNYLEDGFWAKAHDQEIPVEGLSATFVVRIQDVSEQINRNLTDDMSEKERSQKIASMSEEITQEAVNGTHYDAFVRDFFEGNEFYLFVTEKYKDVRLVGAPPESIGKFGHDTDNWMYPRHTGDFSMFRIYAGQDNLPAEYSEENEPLKPKYSLPVSIKGYDKGDFAMVMGFPGSTDRYLSSYGVKQAVNLEQPKRVELRAKKLEIMKEAMDESTEVRLNYASKYAQVANYWKYFIGQTKQVKQNKVAEKKRRIEKGFAKFAEEHPEYADVLPTIESAYKTMNEFVYLNAYQREMIYSVDLNLNVFRFTMIADAIEQGRTEWAMNKYKQWKSTLYDFYDRANMDIEYRTLSSLLQSYYEDIDEKYLPVLIKEKGEKGKIEKYVNKVRKKSLFTSKKKFDKFDQLVEKSDSFPIEDLQEDPLFELIYALNGAHKAAVSQESYQKASTDLKRANRMFIRGYRQMSEDKLFYPNANSTLRLTYGNILPYSPSEDTTYSIYTTLEEGIEKEDPDNPEFHVSPKLKELYEEKDYGRYANENGEMVVNFISNNDITGGNSGSPVINADGELIGTAFDGNWEAMSGDIFFEDEIQRTISCDIRYILFVIDKYGGAENLIEEMDIVEK